MLDLVKRYWRTINRPSVHYSLGFLTLGGFIGGIVFWGAFNTAMELTNTETFCTGCHEMRDNVFAELKTHDSLHQPHRRARDVLELPRAARLDRQDRAQDAGLEGGVGEDLRHHRHAGEVPRQAARTRASTNGRASRPTTRSSAATATSTTRWTSRARACARRHAHRPTWRTREKTCIDCHKGIAHQLPNMTQAALDEQAHGSRETKGK